MQIRKQRKTSPARQPLLCIGCQLPDVWGEQLHQQGEMKHSWQEKGGQNWSVSSFWDIVCLFYPLSFLTRCCPLWWEVGWVGVGVGGCLRGCFPGGHRGCPNINYIFVHLWLTLWWPWLTSEWKRSSKISPPPVALFHAAKRLHMGH